MAAQHETETGLASLRDILRDLVQQLKVARSNAKDPSTVRHLRTNIVQVNNHIENVSLEQARFNHKRGKRH